MKKFIKNLIVVAIVLAVFGFTRPIATLAAGPTPVNLLSISTNNLVILSETGITNTGSHTSAIIGNIGNSPGTAAQMNNVFCSEITGLIYGVDAAYVGSGTTTCSAPGPGANKTLVDNAVLDMGTAYTDAAGRTLPTATELGAGNIGGMTLAPGLYKWSTGVTIPTNVTLSGGANDVWIFQIAGDLSIASGGSVPAGIKVILAGGAQASNVFWQVGGPTGATLGTYATFNGTILSAKQVIIQTGAVLNGRALAQSQVTLDHNVVSVSNGTNNPPSLGKIRGTKFEDLNGDGKLKDGDHQLSGWTIYLDADNNGNLNTGELSTITDNHGNYDFSNLPAGTYTVREVIQSGWIQTYPSNGFYTIVLATGKISKDNNFGNFHLGSISGRKFNDANGNGKKDNGEVGLSGWKIYLDTNNNGVLDGSETSTVTTGVDGTILSVTLAPEPTECGKSNKVYGFRQQITLRI